MLAEVHQMLKAMTGTTTINTNPTVYTFDTNATTANSTNTATDTTNTYSNSDTSMYTVSLESQRKDNFKVIIEESGAPIPRYDHRHHRHITIIVVIIIFIIIRITGVIAGSEADDKGVRNDDYILTIDGITTTTTISSSTNITITITRH